jgi:Fe-Mn family superoxide dismutase
LTRLSQLPYEHLEGISESLLADHFDLYRRYGERLNALQPKLGHAVRFAETWTVARMARDEGLLLNAVRLHELYFTGLVPGGRGVPADAIPAAAQDLVNEIWLLAQGSTGWVVLAYEPDSKAIFPFTMANHAEGYVAGARPLLVLDCYEHAYMPQYGLAKDDYIEAFFRNVDWGTVEARLETARR